MMTVGCGTKTPVSPEGATSYLFTTLSSLVHLISCDLQTGQIQIDNRKPGSKHHNTLGRFIIMLATRFFPLAVIFCAPFLSCAVGELLHSRHGSPLSILDAGFFILPVAAFSVSLTTTIIMMILPSLIIEPGFDRITEIPSSYSSPEQRATTQSSQRYSIASLVADESFFFISC